MEARGRTICLNMIVKDESPVIRRCLDSVRPLIDAWVIVDTGSCDGTQQIVRDCLKELPGELHERPWRNFAYNRTEALQLAKGHADYLLFIDADEVLEVASGFELPTLVADSYNVQVSFGGCTYLRKQLVRNALPWRYEGVVHEYITCEYARTEEFLLGLVTVPNHDGARARDPATYRRDASMLETALLSEPANTRYVFYLAQSYRDAGELALAMRNYGRRVEMGGWTEEVWYSLFQIGQLQERMQHPWSEVLDSYLRAWQYKPDRAEPLHRIAVHYQASKEYHLSHLFLSRAIQVPLPPPSALFVDQPLYDYHLRVEYGVACYYLGQHAEAIAANNALLRSRLLPRHAMDQVVRNRRFSLDALFPMPQLQSNLHVRVVVPVGSTSAALNACVESLSRQECDAFHAVFVDSARASESLSQLPSDLRFTISHESIDSCVRNAALEDVVVMLAADYRLAGTGVLQHIRELFADPICMLAYGQLRLASGELGFAEPAPNPEVFQKHGDALAAGSPLAFRRRLIDHAGGWEPDRLFRAAGFDGTRFSDTVWVQPAGG
jgi:glycosyltransferase involved in cell wall biosynthesis